jgi:phosphopantothenoylcysteine decarboxylase/phosphopantothenate--cysteine ligase
MVEGKKILLGICGSIAAYKSILLTRLLIKEGAEVKVLMTPSAKDFVTALSLSTISKNEVLVDFSTHDVWNNHVQLGRWADVMLIAPLSCNTLAKIANGIGNRAYYFFCSLPVAVAPAMMKTCGYLPRRSIWINWGLEPDYTDPKGELASGLMEKVKAEPEQIISS